MNNERWIVIKIIRYLKMCPNNLKIPTRFINHFESKFGAFISHLFKKLIQINFEINFSSCYLIRKTLYLRAIQETYLISFHK